MEINGLSAKCQQSTNSTASSERSGRVDRLSAYLNTCDPAQVWTTARFDNQAEPNLTVQNLTFTRGNSTAETFDGGGGGGGGGALFVRGGRVRIINSTFTDNRCDTTGPDVGGGALRVLSQHNLSVIVATSTFTGNTCSNGGAL